MRFGTSASNLTPWNEMTCELVAGWSQGPHFSGRRDTPAAIRITDQSSVAGLLLYPRSRLES